MLVLPGDRIGSTNVNQAGQHTAVHNDGIYSTVIGTVNITNTVHVTPLSTRSTVPRINEMVLCRVTKVTPRFAGVDIIGVRNDATAAIVKLPYPFKATIRSHDIYNVEERDAPGVYDSFRPTDLVLAQVIGTGDTSTGLLLSTGVRQECGVVMARSVAGGRLLPVAWNEMVCDRTGQTERRKVAKP